MSEGTFTEVAAFISAFMLDDSFLYRMAKKLVITKSREEIKYGTPSLRKTEDVDIQPVPSLRRTEVRKADLDEDITPSLRKLAVSNQASGANISLIENRVKVQSNIKTVTRVSNQSEVNQFGAPSLRDHSDRLKLASNLSPIKKQVVTSNLASQSKLSAQSSLASPSKFKETSSLATKSKLGPPRGNLAPTNVPLQSKPNSIKPMTGREEETEKPRASSDLSRSERTGSSNTSDSRPEDVIADDLPAEPENPSTDNPTVDTL